MQSLKLSLIEWAKTAIGRITTDIARIPIGTLSDPKQAEIYQSQVKTVKFLEARLYDMIRTLPLA